MKLRETGLFLFLPPYDIKQTYGRLEVSVIYSAEDVTGLDIDLFDTVYKPYGLTKEDMDKDIRNKIDIVCLVNDCERFYIPSNKVVKPKDEEYIPYKRYVIAVNLGALPLYENKESVLEEIKTVVTNDLGIIPDVKLLGVSDIEYVTKAKDSTFNLNRDMVKVNDNKAKQLVDAQMEIERLNKVIKDMECIIKTLPIEEN